MKYVVCVPDGCADEPIEELNGRTPLEAANMPNVAALASRAEIGRAEVIPPDMAPGSDVGNMAIFGFDPQRYHTGRSPIEAAAMGVELGPDDVAFRCNLVTVDDNGTMVDFSGGHPTIEQGRTIISALQDALGSSDIRFYAGVEYRHCVVLPRAWSDATCVPPHDLTGKSIVLPVGAAADKLIELMDASRSIVQQAASAVDLSANQIWLWGQGVRPELPNFQTTYGLRAALTSAVDIVRGLGVLTDMEILDVPSATAAFDNDYAAQRKAALNALEDVDLVLIHVAATDEAGHAGLVEEKVRALELWDAEIIGPLVATLVERGDFALLLMPDHATLCETKTHNATPVPYLMFDSRTPKAGGTFSERGVSDKELVPAHTLMRRFTQAE